MPAYSSALIILSGKESRRTRGAGGMFAGVSFCKTSKFIYSLPCYDTTPNNVCPRGGTREVLLVTARSALLVRGQEIVTGL